MTVLCSSYMVFKPVVGQYLLLLGGNIGEFYTSKYIYRAVFSCSYPTTPSIFSAFFHCFSFFWFFMPFFQQFVPITGSVFFSIYYMLYLHFWGTLFSSFLAKGMLGQCHLHIIPTYFLQTLNMYLFAGEVLHKTTKDCCDFLSEFWLCLCSF